MKRGFTKKETFFKVPCLSRETQKKAQFFLLAAVIISAIVISLGITANRASVLNEPEHFYDYSYNVKKEVGAVVDYEIYSGFKNNANLDNFVNLLAKDIRDKDDSLNFLFIYGNSSKLVLKNYGSKGVPVMAMGTTTMLCGDNFKIKSTIRDKISSIDVPQPAGLFNDNSCNLTYTNLDQNKFVNVNIRSHNFSFDVSDYKQVIFIIEKEGNNESYVAV